LANRRIASEALRVVGLYADTDLEAFEDLLGGPGESDAMKHAMATAPASSTCGLVARGIWRRAGVKHKALYAPYVPASAIGSLWQIARETGAWETSPDYEIEPGDLLMLDVDKSNGHVSTVVTAEKLPNGWKLGTVDGGAQSAGGAQGVAARTHWLTRDGGGFTSSNSLGVTHRLTGVVSSARLASIQSTDPIWFWLVGLGALGTAAYVYRDELEDFVSRRF